MQGAGHDGHWYGEVVPGVQEVLDEAGYHLLLSRFDPEQEQLPASVAEARVDGLLAWINLPTQTAAYLAKSVPTVFADRSLPGLRADCVLNNYEQSMRLQLQHLWELGHRHLVVLDQDTPVEPQRLRQVGAQAFFNEHPMRPEVAALSRPRPFSPSTNEQILDEFISELVATEPRPTGIVLTQSTLGQMLVNRLRAAKLEVPRDISVLIILDSIHNRYCDPALTSFSVPAREMGRAAAELLLKRIDAPDSPPQELRILGHRVDRASVGPPPAPGQ